MSLSGFVLRAWLSRALRCRRITIRTPRAVSSFMTVVLLLGDHTAALTTGLPPYVNASSVMHISNQPVSPESERHDVGQRTVSPEYFEVLRVRLLRGRTFNVHDGPSSEPVAVINDA